MNAVRHMDTSGLYRYTKFFRLLRSEMTLHDLANADIAKLLERSSQHISRCLNGSAEFTLSEQYKILHYIGRPASDMHLIFPENGLDKSISERR